MNLLWYILIWYAIGFATFAVTNFLMYLDGENLTLGWLMKQILLSAFGAIITLVAVLIFVSAWLSEIDFNKVLIKGRKA